MDCRYPPGWSGNRCNLYALTYLPIDDTGRRYDHPYKPSPAPLHLWKAANAEQRDARRKPNARRRVEKLQGKEAVASRKIDVQV